jgi:hypothetical protein
MKRFIISIIAIAISGFILARPVFAECSQEQLDRGCVSTAILNGGCSCDDGHGSSVKSVLRLVVDILSIGAGIFAVIGISISGVQYLTAGGNEEKTRKAKRRIIEIVIGLALFVLMYSLLYFLVPDFNPSV